MPSSLFEVRYAHQNASDTSKVANALCSRQTNHVPNSIFLLKIWTTSGPLLEKACPFDATKEGPIYLVGCRECSIV